jgi:hypothetical protein
MSCRAPEQTGPGADGGIHIPNPPAHGSGTGSTAQEG